MFLLGGNEFPTTAAQLKQSLATGLAMLVTAPPGRDMVSVVSDQMAEGAIISLARLQFDLTGAAVRDVLPKPSRPTGEAVPGVMARQLHLEASPLLCRGASVQALMDGDDVMLSFARAESGLLLLSPASARAGRVELSVTKDDLQQLVVEAASAAAKTHGIQIEKATLALDQRGPRELAVHSILRARKFGLSAAVEVSGALAIDEQMNLRLRGLSCAGQGMLGNMACGFIRPHLQKLESQPIALAAYALGSLRLEAINFEVGQRVGVKARFAAGPSEISHHFTAPANPA